MMTHGRFTWAADVMDVRSNDNILEIGCGVGFAVHAIVPLLSNGFEKTMNVVSANLKKENFNITHRKYEERLKCC